jgi:hypothetical protein
MNPLTKLPAGKQVLFVYRTLLAVNRLLFFSLRPIERSTRQHPSYIVNKTESIAPSARNISPMQAVIFGHLLATDPTE